MYYFVLALRASAFGAVLAVRHLPPCLGGAKIALADVFERRGISVRRGTRRQRTIGFGKIAQWALPEEAAASVEPAAAKMVDGCAISRRSGD